MFFIIYGIKVCAIEWILLHFSVWQQTILSIKFIIQFNVDCIFVVNEMWFIFTIDIYIDIYIKILLYCSYRMNLFVFTTISFLIHPIRFVSSAELLIILRENERKISVFLLLSPFKYIHQRGLIHSFRFVLCLYIRKRIVSTSHSCTHRLYLCVYIYGIHVKLHTA